MAFVQIPFHGKKLMISSCADSIIRFRLSDTFEPTLFERYNIFRHSDEEAGQVASDGNGIVSGALSVTLDGDDIVLCADGTERRISLFPQSDAQTEAYFNERFDNFGIPFCQIVGNDMEEVSDNGIADQSPKHIALHTEGEIFYGLGENSKTSLILNGKAYMERVVYTECEIPIPFVMTKVGYGLFSNSTVWHGVDVCSKNEREIIWYFPDGELDFVIFAGKTLPDILERFTYYTGRPILLPKWGYGLTYIDQYYADQFEVMNNASRFREKKIPCDSISLEPGWMETKYDRSVNKKWNLERFSVWDWSERTPPPYFFTSALKRYGFKTHLWLCCNHDFTAYEETLAGNPTDFGIPKWFDHLQGFINVGVDSFKMDPADHVGSVDPKDVYANGTTAVEGHNLMQTLYAKEMYYGAAHHHGLRPMHHYCGGYSGSTAYTASTTGDGGGLANTLAWVLNLGMSGVSNVTCDMNIHFKESIHYAFFTAWAQLNSWAGFRQPWWAGEELEKMFTFYDRLRYRLMPYIYSAAIQANLTGMPVCRAMPLVYDDEEFQNSVTQYMFGDAFLVGAFSEDIDLPRDEEWIDCWTMKKYDGGQHLHMEYPEGRGGMLFLRAGAIFPCDEVKQYTDAADAQTQYLAVFPHGESRYTFYEDDGISQEYRAGARAKTEFVCTENGNRICLEIGAREGTYDGMLSSRTYKLRLFTERAVQSVRTANGESLSFTHENGFLCADMPVQLDIGSTLDIELA